MKRAQTYTTHYFWAIVAPTDDIDTPAHDFYREQLRLWILAGCSNPRPQLVTTPEQARLFGGAELLPQQLYIHEPTLCDRYVVDFMMHRVRVPIAMPVSASSDPTT